MYFDFLYNCEIFLCLRTIQRNIINVHTSSCKSTGCSYQILMKLKFSRHILEKYSSNFMKIRPRRVEWFHADGQTGMTKLVVDFCNFVNSPQNWQRVLNLDSDLVLNVISVCYCRFQVLRWQYLEQQTYRPYDTVERRSFKWCVCVTLN